MEGTEKKLTNKQQYFKNQIEDLEKKEQALNFQLDQIKAALLVFSNSFTEATKEAAEEVLEESKKIKEDKK
tara:strand:+ start:97 stop:309 length:213 start_codon:yes stop_codon:yes gene_type:complete